MENYKVKLAKKLQECQYYHKGNVDKYEYLTGEEVLPSDQSRMVEQVRFTYSSLEKALETRRRRRPR